VHRCSAAPTRVQHACKPSVALSASRTWALQKQLANIRQIQGKLQQSHERSKVVTRGADMRQLREEMQVHFY
jgi:hypothetical protein